MKKSRSVRLVLLGGTGLALTACGDPGIPQDARFFANASECAAVYDATLCQNAEQQSQRVFASEAPRHSRPEECTAEFGADNCEARRDTNGHVWFVPLMRGYMMSQGFGGSPFSQPVYRGGGNNGVMLENGRYRNVGEFDGAGSLRRTVDARPSTRGGFAAVSRGGFGGTAGGFRGYAGG